MKTLKELAAEWRNAAERVTHGHAIFDICADEIDAWATENMPGWVLITKHESTWPEDGRYILANPSGKKIRRYKFFRTHMSAYFGVWYRYLSDYDSPPKSY